MAEIQKADISSRRKALLLLVAGSLIGFVVITLFGQNRVALECWLRRDPSQLITRFKWILWISSALIELPVVGTAHTLWDQSTRILRAERFPPPGATVIRDTYVLCGEEARRRGRIIQFLHHFQRTCEIKIFLHPKTLMVSTERLSMKL